MNGNEVDVGKFAREITDRIYFTEPWLAVRGTEKYETLKQAVERQLGRVVSEDEYRTAYSQAVESGLRRPGPTRIARLLSYDYATLAEMSLADLGRFVVKRTRDTRAASIAHSRVPQLRYDGILTGILRNPIHDGDFTMEERAALAARIVNETRRLAVLRDISALIAQRERGQ